MNRIVDRVALLLLTCALPALSCARGCGEDQSLPRSAGRSFDYRAQLPQAVPADAPALAQSMAGAAPAAADGVWVLRSLRALLEPTGIQKTLATHPAGGGIKQQVVEALEFDPFDLDKLAELGVDPDRPVLLFTTPEGLVGVRIPAKDVRTLEAALKSQVAEAFAPTAITMPPEAGGESGLRVTNPDVGEVTWIAEAEHGFVYFREPTTTLTVEEARRRARADQASWAERLALFQGRTGPDALFFAWAPPTSPTEAKELFGLGDEADSPLMKAFVGAMGGDQTFYTEADGTLTIALVGNGLRFESHDRVENLAAERARLATAWPVAEALAVVPEGPMAIAAMVLAPGDLGLWSELVGAVEGPAGRFMAALGQAAADTGLAKALFDRPDRLRTALFALYAAADDDEPLDGLLVMELGGEPATIEKQLGEFWTHANRAVPDLAEPATSRWEDFPIWYLSGSVGDRGPVCSLAATRLVCALTPDLLRRALALHRERMAPGAAKVEADPSLVMFWHADLERVVQAPFMRQLGLFGGVGAAVRNVGAAVGTVSMVERLAEDGASMSIALAGRGTPVLGALLEAGLGLLAALQ